MAFNESVYKEYINSLYRKTTPEKTTQLYTKFVKQYDDIMDFESFAYLGDRIAVEAFVELELDKSIRILDLAAGQGRVAKLLRSYGYENVDALDGSIEMLEVAQSQGLYQNYFHCIIDKDTVLPIGDNTYDATIAAGCMGKAHVCIEVVAELVRITKSGKYWLL
jgi:ubiquinone/menaquinone biosynthesis C-methylase UbiE